MDLIGREDAAAAGRRHLAARPDLVDDPLLRPDELVHGGREDASDGLEAVARGGPEDGGLLGAAESLLLAAR